MVECWILSLWHLDLKFFIALTNITRDLFIPKEAPLEYTIPVTDSVHIAHVILPIYLLRIFKVTDKSLTAWHSTPAHEVVVNFNDTFSPATRYKFVVWRYLKVLTF